MNCIYWSSITALSRGFFATQSDMLKRKGRTFFYKKGKKDEKDYSCLFFAWSVLLLLSLWTLWGIFHFSRTVVLPSFMNKMRPIEKNEEDNHKEDEFFIEENEEEIFRKKMKLLSGSGPSCKGPPGTLLLKTHKTGSSTLANILNRYADQNKLTVALPHKNSRFGWPDLFNVKSVDLKLMNGRSARVLTNHARLNRNEMRKVMVKDTFYISILRNPIEQFQSAFYYLQMDKVFGLRFSQNPLQDFIMQPTKHMKKLSNVNKIPEDSGLYQNGMFYDLGYDELQLKMVGVDTAIQNVEKDIDLFLLLEYFDESLILLKKAMCWSIENILYFKQNQRTSKVAIDSASIENIKKWNDADVRLYQHFNRTFWRKVQEYGQNFEHDLKEFRYYLKMWWKRCDQQEVIKGKDASAVRFYVVGKNAKKEDVGKCEQFFRTEIHYLSYFRVQYIQEFYEKAKKLSISYNL